jgi:hypothetical protein
LQDPQTPPEETKVAGIGYGVDASTNPKITSSVSRDDTSNYAPSLSGVGVVHRIDTTESWSDGDPDALPFPIGPSHTITEQIRALEATIFQNPGRPGQLLLYKERTRVDVYEGGNADPSKAKLIRQTETQRQREKSILPGGRFSNMRTLLENQIDYTYGEDEAITQLIQEEKQAEIQFDPASQNPWTLRTTRRNKRQWTAKGTGNWEIPEENKIAKIVEDSNADKFKTKIWGLKTENKIIPASPNNAPPATQFYSAGQSKTETQYEGTALWEHPGGPTGRNRQRLFTVPDGFAFSTAQMQLLAQIHRALLIGRYYGDAGDIEISDALLTTAPLPEISVQDGEIIRHYLADSLTFEFTPTRATAYTAGILQFTEQLYAADINVGDVAGAVLLSQPTGAALLISGDAAGAWMQSGPPMLLISGDVAGVWMQISLPPVLLVSGDVAGIVLTSQPAGGALVVSGDVAGIVLRAGPSSTLIVSGDVAGIILTSQPADVALIVSGDVAGIVLRSGPPTLIVSGDVAGTVMISQTPGAALIIAGDVAGVVLLASAPAELLNGLSLSELNTLNLAQLNSLNL